jgi:hypothetical protein
MVTIGSTTVVVPIPLRPLLGDIVDLGLLYYVCTHPLITHHPSFHYM